MSAPGSGHADGSTPVRIALDVLGGDGAPEVVVDAVPLVLQRAPGVHLVLVGPVNEIRLGLTSVGVDLDAEPRISVSASSRAVAMMDDPLKGVRTQRDVSVRVGSECVRDGRADAFVTVGHTGAAVAAATWFLGRLPGVTRAPLAVVVPSLHGRVVLLDVGAAPTDVSADELLTHAVLGVAYAETLQGVDEPASVQTVRVGLLTIGSEPGKGDALRVAAGIALKMAAPGLAYDYVGGIEGHDVAIGGVADVVVTDGFTGNVLLKGLEGAAAWGAVVFGGAYDTAEPARATLREIQAGPFSAGLLLGVRGVVVVGHGASTAESVASCVALAARVVRDQVLDRVERRLSSRPGESASHSNGSHASRPSSESDPGRPTDPVESLS